MSRGEKQVAPGRSVGGDGPRGQWLTRGAFVLAVAIVVARVMMLETLRDPFSVVMGGQAVPRGAGAASGVVLDALAWLPLLMVLVRRVVDPGYRLRWAWSQLWVGLLAVWAMASVFWASDQFAAVVGAFHFASAVVLFLAASQVVRTWARLRLVAAITFGLLLVFVAHGMYYRLVDLPDLQRTFERNRAEIFQERGWEAGSFQAEQFARKITGGEMIGFAASPNTFAAVIALACVITFGVMVQRLADRDGVGWAAAYVAGIASGVLIIWYTHSKSGLAAVALGCGAIAAMWAVPGIRKWLGRHARLGYAIGFVGAAVGIAAVVGHGAYHGGLPGDSLNFRWRYWAGGVGLLRDHLLTGVGWNNFGTHYLAVRVQAAAEEIKDPHNLLVRFALELGVVGAVLAVGWLAWLWWDLTRPVLPAADDSPLRLWAERTAASPVGRVAMIAGLAVVLNVLASVDLLEQVAFVVVELFKRGLYFCVLVIGAALVALKRIDQAEADGRFAGWVLHAMLIGLGLFLVQSLIDIAIFEVGPMYLFFLLAGSALGIRVRENAERPRKSLAATAALAGTGLAWVAAVVAIVGPVVMGEAMASEGDDRLRGNRPDLALREYERAAGAVPWNWEYALRAAKAALAAGDVDRGMVWLADAIDRDPMQVEVYLARAGVRLQRSPVDGEAVIKDYARAVELNPQDVGLRVAYADVLGQLGRREEARGQYREALERNAGYDPREPKRLSDAEIARVQRAIEGTR